MLPGGVHVIDSTQRRRRDPGLPPVVTAPAQLTSATRVADAFTALVSPRTGRWLLLGATLLLTLPVLTHGITNGEFFENTDEPVHAVTGLFFADVLGDLPITDPIQYAYRWYAHYPALGVVHWPPFLYLVEGIAFQIFGASPVTARLTILAFTIVGLAFWFRLVSELQNDLGAVYSTILLAFAPAMLLYQQTVMLEIPALSLCIAASYYWLRYLRTAPARPADLYRFAVLAALALLTKQHSFYLAPFCVLTLLVERKLRLAVTWRMGGALGIVLLLAGPFYAVAFVMHGQTIRADVLQGTVTTAVHPLWFYPRVLPGQLGLPLLAAAMIGLLTSPWWTRGDRIRVMVVWIVACYLSFSFLGQKTPRYILSWVPAFVFFAVGPLTNAALAKRLKWVTVPLLAILVVYQTWWAWHFQRPYISGYEAAARRLMENSNPGIVLFDGELHSNLIFFVRVHDPQRRAVVLRKALYVTRIVEEYGSKELVHDRGEVENLLSGYGIRYIFVDNSDLHFESQRTLRDVLKQPRFRLVATFPIKTNVGNRKDRKLFLYEDPNPPRATAQLLDVQMLTLSDDIKIPLHDLQIR